MTKSRKLKVMIAGIGGASLGTEILKALLLAERYEVFGCDISPTAYGLYDPGFSKCFLVRPDRYVESVIDACHEAGAQWVIPGGEQPMVLLGAASQQFAEAAVELLTNRPEIVETFSDKAKTFERLSELGFSVPSTQEVKSAQDLESIKMPCVVKPATGSGGSTMVFFATGIEEAMSYSSYIRNSGAVPLVQEYIGLEEGEFTAGVLNLPGGKLLGSIAMRRSLDNKLSVMTRDRGGLISSGYSQGFIGDFAEIRNQVEAIALAIGSEGPVNIQGRLRNGEFIPFEINPRLSASTYLRAMAGFNEVDMLLQNIALQNPVEPGELREGFYLRSFTENYVSAKDLQR